MKRSSPTIRDVAALAGVSHQTVSRVINGIERVNPETREKVEEAIAALGYRPNAIARSMAQGRTCMLACVAPNLTDFTFASIIEGAEGEARKHGYFTLAAAAALDSDFENVIEQLVGHQRIDGIIVISPCLDSYQATIAATIPSVFVSAPHPSGALQTVDIDNYQGGYDATTYLYSLGYRRVGLITGPQQEITSQERSRGYEEAVRAAQETLDADLIAEGDWSATSGYRAFQKIWNYRPQAIFAENDRMAVGVIRAARDAGLSIPEDLAVVGFDDMPLASYFDPSLTTIRQDTEGLGREAVLRLVELLQTPELPGKHTRLATTLVARGSTAPLKRR